MTAKIAFAIVCFGLIAVELLSVRQARLQVSHEISAARLRVRDHDERLLELRARIAREVTPEAVRRMLLECERIEELAPLAERIRTIDPPAGEAEDPPDNTEERS